VTGRTRVLGIDYGQVRVGLAVSDPDRKIASPLATYVRRNEEADRRYFNEIAEREQIGLIVVGLPLHLSGAEGRKATEARRFGEWLHQITGLGIVYWDEQFSTVEAESHLWAAELTHKQRKARRDRLAAQIFLQAYLDAGCPQQKEFGPLEG
jgi:putative Holliday junction resolvase